MKKLRSAFAAMLLLFISIATAEAATKPARCMLDGANVDDYLWELYQKTPKIDSHGEFGHKDRIAARRAKVSLRDYVLGRADCGVKKLAYKMLKAAEIEGHEPGVTTFFRDDFRQGMIKKGTRARKGWSFHGGSKRGGIAFAFDAVSRKGDTRAARLLNSQKFWLWIDEHPEYKLGRPYKNKDAPHVAPLDGLEYKLVNMRKTWKLARAKSKLHATPTAKKRFAGKVFNKKKRFH